MSIPAIAVLYGGLVQRRWAMNTVLMVFSTFCLTLIVWVLWAFKMGFGSPWISTFVGAPGAITGSRRPSPVGSGGYPVARRADAEVPVL